MFRLRSNQQVISSGQSNKLYIQNLDSQTTEDDLIEFLSPWNPRFVYIPYEVYMGVRNYHPRSFGKALVVFDHVEDATRVIDELNGTLYKDKCLIVDYHIPFSPTKNKKKDKIRKIKQSNEILDATRFSNVTIYCRAIPLALSDIEIKNMLMPYNPLDLKIKDAHDDCIYFQLLHPECVENGMIRSIEVTFKPGVDIMKICNELNTSTDWHRDLQFRPAPIKTSGETVGVDTSSSS